MKHYNISFCLILALTAISPNDCICFQPVARKQNSRSSQLWSKTPSDKALEAVLSFSASLHYCTPIQVTINEKRGEDTYETVSKFFENDKNALLLLVGSGNMESRIMNKTPVERYESEWKTEAAYFKSDKIVCPVIQEKSRLVELRTETPFLVFTICAMALLGKQLTTRRQQGGGGTGGSSNTAAEFLVPEIQFVLLQEDFEATDGPPPLIWVFNQLTGKGKHPPTPFITPVKSDDRHHNVHSFLQVYPVIQRSSQIEDDEKGTAMNKMKDLVTFHAICKAEINIAFPSLLLHILPVAKEIIEHQGQNALKKSMERDLIPGMNNFARQFRRATKHNL